MKRQITLHVDLEAEDVQLLAKFNRDTRGLGKGLDDAGVVRQLLVQGATAWADKELEDALAWKDHQDRGQAGTSAAPGQESDTHAGGPT